jgi:hypothetical protein
MACLLGFVALNRGAAVLGDDRGYSEKLRMSWTTVIHAQHPSARSPSTPTTKSIVKVTLL